MRQSRAAPEGLQDFALHLQIAAEVPSSGGHAGVTEVVADYIQINASLQQSHRAAVPKYVRGGSTVAEVGKGQSSAAEVFRKQVRDAVTAERVAPRVAENLAGPVVVALKQKA